MENKHKFQKIVYWFLFFSCFYRINADSIPYTTIFNYTVKGLGTSKKHSCGSIEIDSTVSKYGYSSFRCLEDTEMSFFSLSEKVVYEYSLYFKNGVAMYVSLSFRRDLFGSENLRDAEYKIDFSFFQREKGERQEELALKLINWFERVWLKNLKWEKKIRNLN